MKKGEHYIVISHHGSRHPVGTEVVIVDMVRPENNDKPYYCRAVQGSTCYWYEPEALARECDGIKVQ